MRKTKYQNAVRVFISGNYDRIDAMVDQLRTLGEAIRFAMLLEGYCIVEKGERLPA